MRRAQLATALLAISSLVLVGCGGDDGSDDETPEAQSVAGGDTLSSTWPLTGLPVDGDASSSTTRPVLVVKMDNTSSSAPQLGLGEADMVVEELVEGGLTRLAAFYYSDIPDLAGPVRSMRASDIDIVSPVDGEMVTSGAANVTINRIKGAGITFHAYGTEGFYRADDRVAPYNVIAEMPVIEKAARHDEEARPQDYLEWGTDKDFPGGQAATDIDASFGGRSTSWHYDGKHYINENSYASEDDQFEPDTVLVLRVQIGDAGYKDPAGAMVPETKLVGKGEAMVFHGGKLVRGTWSKPEADSTIALSTKAGDLKVPAGHTWIELVPVANGQFADGDVTFTK